MKAIIWEGGIPFVKTNLPILSTGYSTSNPSWGEASNPWDVTRSTGGSTGGEAGLICSGSSPIGFGTDTAGSLRCPANACGIVSFMPTPSRLTMHDVESYLDQDLSCMKPLSPVIGPLAKTVSDIKYIMEILCSESLFKY